MYPGRNMRRRGLPVARSRAPGILFSLFFFSFSFSEILFHFSCKRAASEGIQPLAVSRVNHNYPVARSILNEAASPSKHQ